MFIVLPGQPGDGSGLTSFPKDPYAKTWKALPLPEAIERRWNVDAHILGYTDLAGLREKPPRWHRYSQGVLADEERAEGLFLGAVFADVDRNPHTPWRTPGEAKEATAAVFALYPDACAVYSTRSGVRVVWQLEELVPIRHATWWLRQWHAQAARQDLAPLGLKYDLSCAEWTRCFRLPHVVRDGEESNPAVLVRVGRRLAWTPEGEPVVEVGHPTAEAGPEPTGGAAPRDWAAWIRQGSIAGKYQAMLAEGRPFGPPDVEAGTRNTQLLSLVHSLAAQLWRRGSLTPEDLYHVVAPSVKAELRRDPGAPGTADLWRMCQTAAAKEQERGAAVQSVAPVDGAPPPLVSYRNAGFVYDNEAGTYRGPLVGSDLFLMLRDVLPNVPRNKGPANLRKITEILDSHAVRAENVELHYPGVRMGIAWVPGGKIARVQVIEQPTVAPQEDPLVARWLSLLFRENGDKALDWLATVADLGRPTCTLYMQGPPGAGKGMLVAGVAALWGRTPIAFRDAVGKFTDPLLRSPIVLLDEHAAMDRAESGAFRSLGGERVHRIESKGLPVLELHGCPRVMVASNGDGALDIAGGEHGTDDLDAIISRILHLNVSGMASAWLAEQGGMEFTHDWVFDGHGAPGRIARHVAWLAANRQVKRGSRFLVEGVEGRYHQRLVTSDPLYASVLVSIAVAMLEKDAMRGHGPTFIRGDGDVWVNPAKLHARFRSLVSEDHGRPTLQRVAGACAALSHDESAEDIGGTLYWRIPGSLVQLVAVDLGIPEAGRIPSVLKQPGVVPGAAKA